MKRQPREIKPSPPKTFNPPGTHHYGAGWMRTPGDYPAWVMRAEYLYQIAWTIIYYNDDAPPLVRQAAEQLIKQLEASGYMREK